MGYDQLMIFHLVTVVPCFFIGAVLLCIKKRTNFHKKVGRIYMILMMVTAVIILFMPAHIGPRFLNHFGWIHSFSFLTIFSVPAAIRAARAGDIKSNKRISLYFGAIIIAGGFTFFQEDIYIMFSLDS